MFSVSLKPSTRSKPQCSDWLKWKRVGGLHGQEAAEPSCYNPNARSHWPGLALNENLSLQVPCSDDVLHQAWPSGRRPLGRPSLGTKVHFPAGLGVSVNTQGAAAENFSLNRHLVLLCLSCSHSLIWISSFKIDRKDGCRWGGTHIKQEQGCPPDPLKRMSKSRYTLNGSADCKDHTQMQVFTGVHPFFGKCHWKICCVHTLMGHFNALVVT